MGKAVQVWMIPLDVSEDTLRRYFTYLSEDEQVRADRFRFEADRRRFAVARGTLRQLLAREFGQTPHEIEFCYGEYGKPTLGPRAPRQHAWPDAQSLAQIEGATAEGLKKECRFHFNLSHSGEVALCALGHHRPIGIDIEKIKPMQRLDSMMSRCFTQQEQRQVAQTDNPSHTFLQYWTCKEAYLKAIGLGLTQSMQTVEVQLAPPRLITVPQKRPEGWQLSLLSLPTANPSKSATQAVTQAVTQEASRGANQGASQGASQKAQSDEYVCALVVAGAATVNIHPWTHQ